MGETSGYEIMAETKSTDKLEADINEFIVVTKVDSNIDTPMEVESVEALINQTIESTEETNENAVDVIKEQHVYFEGNLNTQEESTENYYNPCFESVMLEETKVKGEWNSGAVETLTQEVAEDEEQSIREFINSEEMIPNVEDNENSDEETIATFITSAGQQLALYAVEDSDEVFAVAVYSESGEPPTNFQFLMKADVERLIGEGAIRTVKKPQQMKKQTYQGELITSDKDVYRKSIKNSPNSKQVVKNSKHEIQTYDVISPESYVTQSGEVFLENRSRNIFLASENDDDDDDDDNVCNEDLTYQDVLDSSYFLLDHEPVKEIISPKVIHNKKLQDEVLIKQIDDEIAERSTVQYILCDNDDQSDSELTFDEIKKSLQRFDKHKKNTSLLKKSMGLENRSGEKVVSNGVIKLAMNLEVESPQSQVQVTPDVGTRRVFQSTSVKHRHPPNALLGRRSPNYEPKQTVFIQGSTALICCPIADFEGSLDTSCKESSDSSFKIKRPRKQQLTIVNRADSEIIIQPASMVSDEEEEQATKKRGKRKKRRQENIKSSIKTRGSYSKRIASNERRSRIEIIEIDVDNDGRNVDEDDEDDDDDDEGDENYRRPRRSNIKEVITIEDGKEKDSSDKENEVIMVGDSDDDEDDETDENKEDGDKNIVESQTNIISTILKCDHCSRSFRQKRALETHSRICPKSPNSRRRLTRSSSSASSSKKASDTNRSVIKKQYMCKICSEKFDVVVALARHVRSHHKKKKETSGNMNVEMKNKKDKTDKNINTLTVSKSVQSKKNKIERQIDVQRESHEKKIDLPPPKQDYKKKICNECCRWFASAALLSTHLLKHGIKKSNKHRCQICKKLFRSRLIYIRHLHVHNSNSKQLQKRIKRTRQSTSTITTLRKRGRPRKL